MVDKAIYECVYDTYNITCQRKFLYISRDNFFLFCFVPDQWSPINLEGKKQYDRGFLLLLQTDPLSLERPPNLPNMDIIKDKSMTMNVNKVAASSAAKDWMPGFIKTTMNARVS